MLPASLALDVGAAGVFTVQITGGSPSPTLRSCSSATPTVATTTASGPGCAVTAVSQGQSVIAATTSDNQVVTGTVTVSAVNPALSAFTVLPTTLNLLVGQAGTQLVPTATTPSANVVVNVTYVSSVQAVATVSAAGLVSGVAPGQATIAVTATGQGAGYLLSTRTVTVPVTVSVIPDAFPGNLTVVPTDTTLRAAKTVQIVPSVSPAGAGVVVSYSYRSSAINVATVSASGVITAIAPGTSTVTTTATGSGAEFKQTVRSATTTVTVVDPCFARSVTLFGVPTAGRFDASSCLAPTATLPYSEYRMFTVDAQSRVRLTISQSTGTVYNVPVLSADGWLYFSSLTQETALVPAGTWEFGFFAATIPIDFQYSIARNPVDDCTSLKVLPGIISAPSSFTAACQTQAINGVTASYRELDLLPPLSLGESFTLTAQAATFPVRIDLFDSDTKALVASAEATTSGAAAVLAFTRSLSSFKFYYALVSNRRATTTFGNITLSFSKSP
jgi:hypothetical protein